MKLITSVVPPGLKNQVRPRRPSDKSLGYYQISLREKDLKHLIHDKDVPKPKGEAPAEPELRKQLAYAAQRELRPPFFNAPMARRTVMREVVQSTLTRRTRFTRWIFSGRV